MAVRHGETEWSAAGRHTGRTDVGLTERGRRQARALARALAGLAFAQVLTSPAFRARETCALAGLGSGAQVAEELSEWDYGDFEGRTTADIRRDWPGWSLWRHGPPGGETAGQVRSRVDRLVARLRDAPGPVAVFAHGHVLRVLAARWVGLGVEAGALLALDPATVSVLGYEREVPVVAAWNCPIDLARSLARCLGGGPGTP